MYRSAVLLLSLASLLAACPAEGPDTPDGLVDADQEAGGPTYRADIQPLARAKCSPCHSAGGTAGADFTDAYEVTQRAAGSCPGMLVSECMAVLVRNGTMPLGAGCSGDPASDEGNPACLTAEELELLDAWIAAGGPE